MTGSISSIGIGSGLDVESIISQMVAIEKKPLDLLQTQATKIQTQISTYGQISSLVSTLQDAASALSLDGTWNTKTVTSSNSSAITAKATGNPSATSFSMGVSQLARAQSAASGVVAAGSPVGAGTLSIQLGAWSGDASTFTPGTAAAVDIGVSSTDTLTSVAAKINDANAGVVATVLTDASGQRLLLRSKDTGEAAGFRVQATESGGAGLSALSFDPQNASGVGMAADMATYQSGLDAKATINGVAVTSATNTFSSLFAGLSVTATAVTTAPAEIQVATDSDSIKSSIQSFVDAYNALNDLLSTSTKYDSDTNTAGVMQGDSSTVNLMNSLRSVVTGVLGSGAYQHLSDIGIEFQRGGDLKITNESKLDDALGNSAELKTLFTAKDGSGNATGIAARMKSFATMLLSTDGLVTTKYGALEKASSRNVDEQGKVNDKATSLESRLRAQYTALDTQMAQLTSLSTFMTQQITNWNKSKG